MPLGEEKNLELFRDDEMELDEEAKCSSKSERDIFFLNSIKSKG